MNQETLMQVAGTAETGSKTTRAAAPGGVSAGGPRLGLALLVLATAQGPCPDAPTAARG
jgi:hypothetical protein